MESGLFGAGCCRPFQSQGKPDGTDDDDIDGIVSFTFILTLHNSDGVPTGFCQMLYIDLSAPPGSRRSRFSLPPSTSMHLCTLGPGLDRLDLQILVFPSPTSHACPHQISQINAETAGRDSPSYLRQ